MLINVKMPTLVGILTFMNWISFMLSWIEYEKTFYSLGPSPVWTFIEDICAYIYDDKAYKNLMVWPKLANYESIRTLSYSFISTLDHSGPEHQQIYSLLRETEQVSLCFHARIQRGGRGSGPPRESRSILRTKNEELFSDSRAWTPHPLAKISGSAHGFALGTYNHGSI